MSTTNHTTNYELSQYIGTDVTSYLSNYNSDMFKIDAQMKVNATDAATAKSDATSAVSTATSAASSASAAVSTANAANTAAEAAQTAATAAQTAAGTAQTDAAAALRASASNTIGNLAPAYDRTLTYAVGNLVTYVDPETNQGKLYKNIIPIAVPEEFNINKWDDVTTSEAYQPKGHVLASVTADGVLTRAEIYAQLYNSISNIDYMDAHMTELHIDNGDYHSKFIHTSSKSNRHQYSKTDLTVYNTSITSVRLESTSSSSLEVIVEIDTNGTITRTNASEDVPSAGSIFSIYML